MINKENEDLDLKQFCNALLITYKKTLKVINIDAFGHKGENSAKFYNNMG